MDTATTPSDERIEFSFAGTASEYFRIWMVNSSLTILTLGVYSPWATVRNTRYLYRSMQLGGSNLDFHASPITILKGRAIALVALIIYLATGYYQPAFQGVVLVLILLAIPWLIVRSRMFRMRNTSYRNIRFGFEPVYAKAFKTIYGYGLLVAVTLGIAYPHYQYKRADLIVSNTRFGNLSLSLGKISGGYFARYISAGLVFVVVPLVVVFLINSSGIAQLLKERLPVPAMDVPAEFRSAAPQIAAEIATNTALDDESLSPSTAAAVEGSGDDLIDESMEEPTDELSREQIVALGKALLVQLPAFVAIGLLFSFVSFLLSASLRKLLINNTTVGEHALRCDWSVLKLALIQLSNLVLIVLSIGLLIPWATIRAYRYQTEHVAVELNGTLDTVVAGQSDYVSAFGDEIGDAFDVDIGL